MYFCVCGTRSTYYWCVRCAEPARQLGRTGADVGHDVRRGRILHLVQALLAPLCVEVLVVVDVLKGGRGLNRWGSRTSQSSRSGEKGFFLPNPELFSTFCFCTRNSGMKNKNKWL